MASIYLIRHCESEGNACRRTQAQTDALVTARGYQQSEMLRRRFSDTPIDALYASDAFRSIMTVEPIARERKLPVRVRIQLREVTTGIWEDMAWGNIAQDYPEDYRHWVEHPWAHTTPGASTFQQAAERLVFALRRIAREVGDGTALCVSHSCTIKAGLCAILGRPLSDVAVVGHGDNTAVSLLHVDDAGAFAVEYMNDDSHLPTDLRRLWNGVAGGDVNLAVNAVRSDRDMDDLLRLMHRERLECAGTDDLDDARCRAHALALLAEHPNYIALSYLRGEAVGYVRMEEEALTPDDCGHIGAMYIVPDLRGNCYAEQLFGYAAHEFRYGGKRIVTMALPVLPEERRIAERFLFTRMQGSADRIALALFSPPSPYPILA